MLPQAAEHGVNEMLETHPLKCLTHAFLHKGNLYVKINSCYFRSLKAAECKDLVHSSVKLVRIFLFISIGGKTRREAWSKLTSGECVKSAEEPYPAKLKLVENKSYLIPSCKEIF